MCSGSMEVFSLKHCYIHIYISLLVNNFKDWIRLFFGIGSCVDTLYTIYSMENIITILRRHDVLIFKKELAIGDSRLSQISFLVENHMKKKMLSCPTLILYNVIIISYIPQGGHLSPLLFLVVSSVTLTTFSSHVNQYCWPAKQNLFTQWFCHIRIRFK